MAGLTESWIQEKRAQGNSVAGSGDDYAVAVIDDTEDDYVILYDLTDGHPLRVPAADRQYMLAKRKPLVKGERVQWFRTPNGRGMYQSAPGGVQPVYSETPPATTQPTRTPELITQGGGKSVRRSRKRGKRGRGKRSL